MSGWTETFYTNPTLMEAEIKLIDRFEHNWHPMTMEEIMELTGLTERSVRRVFESIRRYQGYKIEMTQQRFPGVSQRVSRWQIIYTPERDPWIRIGAKA